MFRRFNIGKKHGRFGGDPTQDGNGSAPYYVHGDDGSRVELVAHARASGAENLPESSALEPNDVEAAVQREHERRHQDLVEQTRVDLRALTADFDRVEQQSPTTRDLQVAVEQSRAAIEHDFALDDALVRLRQEQQQRRRDLRGFMRDQQLTQPARYPASRLFHLGVIAILVVMESLLNMAFFAQTSELGLIGGFLVAVGVSLTNVALGLAGGFFCLRWRNQRELRLRQLATAGLVLYALVAILFNLGVAHLRDRAASLGAGQQVHLDALLRDPLSLTLSSAVLLVIGLLASVIAARKGFTLDSSTPGHGDVDRRFQVADRAFLGHLQDLRQRILTHAESVPEACKRIVRQAEEGVEQLGQLVVRAVRILEGYEAERERLERWCQQWLRKYRAENEAIRTTPPPGYFSVYPSLPSQVDGEPIKALKERLQRAGVGLGQLKEESRRIALDQPARVAEARDRFAAFLHDALRRADAGRGDGSAHEPGGDELGTQVAS